MGLGLANPNPNAGPDPNPNQGTRDAEPEHDTREDRRVLVSVRSAQADYYVRRRRLRAQGFSMKAH